MTDTRATQVAVEQWITTTPAVQTTQVAVEQWASVAVAVPSSDTRAMVLA